MSAKINLPYTQINKSAEESMALYQPEKESSPSNTETCTVHTVVNVRVQ